MINFLLRAVHKRRPQSGGKGFVQCEHFADNMGGGSSDADVCAFRRKKTFLNIWCSTRRREGWVIEPMRKFFGQEEREVNFSRFCVDVLYGRPLKLQRIYFMCKKPSMKDARKNREKLTPHPLCTKCPHWLNLPLSVRTHYKFWKIRFCTKKCEHPHLKPLVYKMSALGNPPDCGRLLWIALKEVLNPNFRPFSFKLKKNFFFEINFELGFRVLWPRTLKIFEIIFLLSSLVTSSWEP